MSQSRYFIGIFLLVLTYLTIVSAEGGNGRCEAYTGSICAPLYSSTSTMVYIDGQNFTQQEIETQMRGFFGVFGAVERETCGPYLIAMMCSQFLPTCAYDQHDHALPRYPCSGFCPNYGMVKEGTGVGDIAPVFPVPPQCSKFEYFFEKPRKEVTTRVTDFFRPVCWHSTFRQTTLDKSYPIDYLSPSPIDVFRADASIPVTDKGTGINYSPREKAIIDDNNESCEPLYETFVSQATAVVQASENTSPSYAQFRDLRIDFPTHPCPSLLTALPSDKYTSDQEPCVIPCPTLTFTHEQYKQQDTLVIVFNSLSIVCLFVLCLSWTFFPALRLQNYVFYYIICISAMTVALFILIPIARAQDITIAESLCETPTKEYHMKGYPLVQGMVVSFTYMAATAWGLIMVFDIFVQVVVGRHMQKGSRDGILKERLYHAFSWFWGFYSVIGGLASEQIGATVIVGGSYALIIPSRFQQDEGVFNAGNPFFYYPLLILTFVSVFLMFAVLVKLIWFRAQTKTTGLRLATFVRLFIFIIANTFIICVFLVYSIDVNEKRDELEVATTNFTQCLHLVGTFLPNEDPIALCGTAPDHPLDFNILILTVVLFNGMGVIAFLIYGTTTDLVYSWFGSFYIVCGCETFKKYEKDFRRNRKSTKMNTTKTSQHPGGEKSKTSRSGHTGSTVGSGLLTSQHHHDSTTDRSAVDNTTTGRRAMYDDDSRHQPTARSPSQDPKSRGNATNSTTAGENSTSGYQARKTVFQYANNKNQQQNKRRATGGGAPSEISSAQQPTSVEMTTLDE